MLKRTLSFILVLVMVLGMIPTVVFAQEDSTVPTGIINAHYGSPGWNSTIDDIFDLSGMLKNGSPFGLVWQGTYLTVAITNTGCTYAKGDIVMYINGNNGFSQEWLYTTANTAKSCVKYTDVGLPNQIPHNYVADFKIVIKGEVQWEGKIRFTNAIRLAYNATPVAADESSAAWNGGSNASGSMNFYTNKEGNSTSESEDRTTALLTLHETFNTKEKNAGIGVAIDMDVVVDSMPSYGYDSIVLDEHPTYLFPGMNMGVFYTETAGYVMAISKIADYQEGYDKLYLIVANGEEPYVLPLDKDVNEKFHLRLEYAKNANGIGGDLMVFCGDKQLATLEDVSDASGYVREGVSTGAAIHSWVQGSENIQKGEVNFTVSKLYSCVTKADEITVGLGSNTGTTAVTEPLQLPASITCNCDACNGRTLTLSWTSSDTSIMGNDGVPVEGASGNVTLTAVLDGYPNVTQSFTFTVADTTEPDEGGEGGGNEGGEGGGNEGGEGGGNEGGEGGGESIDQDKIIHAVFGTANYSNNTIDRTSTDKAANGACDRYQMTGKLAEGRYFGVSYQGGWLYIGIDGIVDHVAVELNGVKLTAEGGKNPDTEVWVDYRKAGLPQAIPHDYVTTLKLTADDMVWEGLIRFSSSSWKLLTTGTPNALGWGGTHNSGIAKNGIYELWANRKDGNGNYSAQPKEYSYYSFTSSSTDEYLLAEGGTSVLSFNVNVAAMPMYDRSDLDLTPDAHYLFSGLNVGILHDSTATNDAGYSISISRIQNDDGYEGLYLIVKTTDDPVVVPLNKDLAETFNMRFEYTRDPSDGIGGTLSIYCDDVFLGTFENASGGAGYRNVGYGCGLYMISCIYGQENMAKGEVDFAISEMVYGKGKAPVLDQIDQTAMLNGQSADAVTEKLLLPATVSCNCDICTNNPINLVWTSSDTSIMSHDGVPVEGASGQVTMTASVASLDVKREFKFTVPSSDTAAGTKMIFAAYGTPYYSNNTIDYTNSIKGPNPSSDGNTDLYYMTGRLSDGTVFGAMYEGGYLYFGVETKIDTMTVELNGKTVSVGGISNTPSDEVWVDYRKAGLDLAIPDDYVTTLKLTVNGDLTWEGLIRFDSSSRANVDFANGGNWSSYPQYDNISKSDGKYQLYANRGSNTEISNKAYSYMSWGDSRLGIQNGTSVVDFDLVIDVMPEYDIGDMLIEDDPHYIFPGMKMGLMLGSVTVDNATRYSGYAIAISRIKDYTENYDGLYLFIGSKDKNEPIILKLNKDVGEQFHLRFEYILDTHDGIEGALVVYCDDVCLGYFADIADATGYKRGSYNNLGLHFIDWVNPGAAGGEVAFTVSRVVYGTRDENDLDRIKLKLNNLAQNDILGDNIDADNITSNLALLKKITIGEGTYELEWFSSDLSVMSNDGVPVEGVTGAVTMSVRLKDDPTVRKTFDFFVVGEQKTLDAMLATDGITVDGSAGEQAWVKWNDVYGRTEAMPKASVAAAWNKGHLYLMVVSDNTDALKLNLGEKTIDVDVANLAVTGVSGAMVKKNGSYIEIDLPLEGVVKLTDYNESVDAALILSNAVGNSNACINKLRFTGDATVISAMNQFSNGWKLGVNSYAFDHFNEASVFYVYNIRNQFANGKATYITQDFQFNALPAITPFHVNGLETRGFYFYATRNSDNYDVEGQSDILFIAIYREEGDNSLKAMIMNNKSDPNAVIDLGVTLGEQFRLTTEWKEDGSAKLYVDGVLVGQSNGSCTYRRPGAGDKALAYRYYGTGTNDNVDFLIKDITVVNELYSDVTKEMTPGAVLNRADLERVTDDLPMSNTFSSQYIGDLDISWSVEGDGIAADGKVTRTDSNQTGKISLFYKGEKLWTENVTVLAQSAAEQPSAEKYTTAYANDIVINGDLLKENWHMANKILNADGKLVGEMGAAWNQQYLYVAVRNNSKAIGLTVNGKAISLTDENSETSGEYTEIAIPMTDLGLTITDYNVHVPIRVTVDDGSYEGTLVLSSTDWWGAGNAQEALPVYSTTKQGLLQTHTPNENQQAIEVDNGWHLYDRYVAGSENPACVRTCALFFRTSPYENFNKREGTITVEFDFQASSMPIYDSSATVTQDNNAYACYGVNWNFADAQDSQKYANVVAAGIYNNGTNLVLVLRGSQTREIVLNKKVGDLFRITMNWNADNSLDIYIDGVAVHHEENAAQRVSSVGNSSFVLNIVRNEEQPKSGADDIDVYVTNIAFGSAYAESALSNITWDTIRGENTDANNVTSALNLIDQLVNEQLNKVYSITWTSSETNVDPKTGVVTRPETGAVSVKLTATLADGTSKSFTVTIQAESADEGKVLIVRNDTNPAVGQGETLNTILFTFDQYNSSVILDMEEKTAFNLVTLTDLDEYARINRESVTLWVSDDNVTYTQIEDYKLTQVGRYWYLYDFEAEAQYVKAHYTHWNGDEADFTAYLNTMISASWNDGLVAPEDAVEITAPVTTLRDEAAAIVLPDDITTGNLRVSLNGEILFHYVEDGTVYVRIPDPTKDTLVLWNASDIELANKENVYEVTYGTRETYKLDDKLPPRWLLSIEAGTYGQLTVAQDMLIATSSTAIYAGKILVSYDQGLTWETLGTLPDDVKNACILDDEGNGGTGDTGDGGWLFDDATGAIYYICHYANKPSGVDWKNSYAVNVIIASYDMGKTWEHVATIKPDTVDGRYFNYMLSYSGGVKVSSYDGDGAGIDFVFPTGAIYDYNGSFCTRVAYSADGGKTWQMSKSLITYGQAIGDESGLSEAWVAENDQGVLTLYTRCQYEDAVNFAQVYSYDHGLTWTAYETEERWKAWKASLGDEIPNEVVAKASSVYSSNTQALMYEYAQYNGKDAPLFVWGGNNTLGGTSYLRSPLNVAVSYDGLNTWKNIQNLFSETFLERYNGDGRSLITNHSVAKTGDDTLVLTFVQNRANYRQGMTVTDFENYFYRTKGAYDAFESGNPQYEGWVAEIGLVANTDALANEGAQSMYVPKKSVLTRSIPYLQNGTITLDVYVDEATATTFALQPAFGKDPNAYTLAAFRIENMKLTNGNASVDLKSGWNTIEIKLDLTHAEAQFSANGSAAVSAKLNMAVGDYVCYFTVFNDTDIYIDEFMVVSDLDAVVYAGEVGNKASIDQFSPTLEDYVGLNFYVKVEADMPSGESYMLFIHNGNAYKEYESVEKNGYRVYTYKINAKEMADDVSATFYYGDGLYKTTTKTFSVVKYAEANQNSTSESLAQLVKDMAQYGAYAQKYFGYNTGNYADANIPGAQNIEGVTADSMKDYTPSVVNSKWMSDMGLTLSGSLLLKEFTTLRFSFKGNIPEGLIVKVNGEDAQLVQDGNRSYVDVTGIAAKDLDASVVLTVTYNGQTATITYNPLSYCYNVLLNSKQSAELKDLVRSLYLYNQSANAHFGNTQ